MQANQLRRAFAVLRRAWPHPRPVGQSHPARPDAAVHRGGHGAVQAVLRGRGGAAVPARRLGAEVRPGRRQAQRPRRDRPHQAPPHLLRDAGQLLLRRLLQGRGHPLGLGVVHRDARASTPTRLWITVHVTDDEAEPNLARRRSACRPSASSASTRTTSGRHGRHRPVRPVLGDLLGQGPRVRRRRRAGPRRRGALRRDLEPRVHAVRRPARRQPRSPLPKPSIDTGAGLERILTVLQGVDSVWDIDEFVALLDVAQSRLRRAPTAGTRSSDVSLRILAEHARTMTFLVVRRRVPLQRGPRLRAAPHHAPGRPPRLPPRRRRPRHAGHGRRRGVDVMGADYPELAALPRLRPRRHRPRGGAVPPDPEDRLGHPRRRPGRAARRRPARRVAWPSSCTTPTASRSRSPRRSPPSGASSVDVDGFDRPRWPQQRKRAKDARKGVDAERAPRGLPGAGRAVRADRLPAPGRDPPSSMARSLAVIGDARVPRPHAVLRRVRRPGRRHRHDHHRDRHGRGAATPPTRCPGLVRHHIAAHRRHHRPRPGGHGRRSTWSGATPSGATTPAPTCCTGRCARCSATTSSSRARSSSPTGCASTSATTRPSAPRSWPASRTW